VDIRLGQVEEIMENGFATTPNFKTAQFHGFQAVILPKSSLKLLTIYLDFARPVVATAENSLSGSHLFLDCDGNPDLRIGRKLTRFFAINSPIPLHITTTAIRSMYETEAANLYDAGKISKVSKAAVTDLGGHGSTIVKNFYLKRSAADKVRDSKALMDTIYGVDNDDTRSYGNDDDDHDDDDDDNDANDAVVENSWRDVDDFDADSGHDNDDVSDDDVNKVPFPGCDHPGIKNVEGSRFEWSKAEKEYMRKVSKIILTDNPSAIKTICKQMLARIKSDHNAMKIFHPHHILNSTRLRNGWQNTKKTD